MPFYPETQFFQTLAEYPKLLKIINDLTEGGKDDLQDLDRHLKESKLDSVSMQKRWGSKEAAEKIRKRWLFFKAGFTDEQENEIAPNHHQALQSTQSKQAYVEGRKFYQELKKIPEQEQEGMRSGLEAYSHFILNKNYTTCTKCKRKYYLEDADEDGHGRLHCPECGHKWLD